MLASASGGWSSASTSFQTPKRARVRASVRASRIRTYNVIYKLTEDIEQALVGMLTAVTTEETIGEARGARDFSAPRASARSPAACVTNGVIRRGANVRIVRDGTVVYTTTIDSLKRFPGRAREVQEGFECGLHLANFDD